MLNIFLLWNVRALWLCIFWAGIVQYMQNNYGDASKEKQSLKDLKRAMNIDDVTVVAFFESKDDKLYEVYQESGQ